MSNIEIIKNDPNTEKNYQIISFKGEVDRDTMDNVRNTMEQLIPTISSKTLVFNLENLEFINSEGIGYLTDIFNRMNSLDKKVVILKASDRIMDIFQLVGINQIIPCINDESEI